MYSPGHIAGTDDEAREQLYPHQADLITRLGRERGWGPYSRIAFELPHQQRLESVRLYGEEVVPRVRELLSGS